MVFKAEAESAEARIFGSLGTDLGTDSTGGPESDPVKRGDLQGETQQGRQDLNLQPPVLETGALPIELRPWADLRV